jgi:hypothetical protein
VKTKDSGTALKNSWRLIGLVYLLVIGFFLAGATARYWMPSASGPGGAILLASVMLLSLMVAFCFAIAALAWAIWSLQGRVDTGKRLSLLAIGVAFVTVVGLGMYLLIETGVVRLR